MHDTESDTSAVALSLLGLAYILVKRKFKNNLRCVCAHEGISDAYPENGECTVTLRWGLRRALYK